ncbi:MAG: HAD family hydrolase [Candidatus Cloacimonadota bacterium]|nr:HAD family hydrolase [Candidatus Cloacimonadota bacterium]
MNKIKAVIFDMDGVIIDSEPLYFQIQEELFNNLGFIVSKQEYDTFIGAGMQLMWEKLCSKHNLPFTIKQLIIMNNDLIYKTFKNSNSLQATEGFNSFLTSIKEMGIKTAVASSTSKKIINVILSRLGIIHEFDVIISSEEVLQGKPEPVIFLEAATRLNVDPKKCIVIEDSTNGVKAAARAGMKCIGFSNKNSGEQNLSLANIVVDNFANIDLNKINLLFL